MKVQCQNCEQEFDVSYASIHECPKPISVHDMGRAGTAIMEAEYIKLQAENSALKSQLEEATELIGKMEEAGAQGSM